MGAVNPLKLRRRERRLARLIARDAWTKEGPGEDAILAVEGDSRLKAFDPALVALIVQLAILLFKYWMENKIEEPSIIATADEPIDWDTPAEGECDAK